MSCLVGCPASSYLPCSLASARAPSPAPPDASSRTPSMRSRLALSVRLSRCRATATQPRRSSAAARPADQVTAEPCAKYRLPRIRRCKRYEAAARRTRGRVCPRRAHSLGSASACLRQGAGAPARARTRIRQLPRFGRPARRARTAARAVQARLKLETSTSDLIASRTLRATLGWPPPPGFPWPCQRRERRTMRSDFGRSLRMIASAL